MIEEILPAAVVSEDRHDDRAELQLFPEEEAAVAHAVEKRRREFATTRTCARRALARLGAPDGPLLPGPRGEPRWGPGVVGSLTHCDGYRAAAVAWQRDVRALGIDAEPDAALPDGVLDLVSLPAERAALRALPAGVSWDRLLFSAKESVFKVWYPLTGRELGFREAELAIAPAGRGRAGTFTVRLLVDDEPFGGALAGRFVCRHGLVVTGITVPLA